jgi:ThiF family
MVNDRPSRSAVTTGAPIDRPNLFTHSQGWGRRGALFVGNCTDSAEKQSPDVSSPAFAVSMKAVVASLQNRHRSAPDDCDFALPEPVCRPQHSRAALEEIDFVIIGCGGSGSQIAVELAAHGARRFLLADAERIDENDIRDLPWAREADLGSRKTDRLASYLASRFSAHVFVLPEPADEKTELRLIADHAVNPFVVLVGDDDRRANAFLSTCQASRAGIPPHFHVGRPPAPESLSFLPAIAGSTFVAGLEVWQLVQACLAKHSTQRARQWRSDLKNSDMRPTAPSEHGQSEPPHSCGRR